jgi:hypothetical protein
MALPLLETGSFLTRHLSQEPPHEFLSHYTTQHGMLEIIKSGELWASNISFLNDNSEYLHGVELIKRISQDVSADDEERRVDADFLARSIVGTYNEGSLAERHGQTQVFPFPNIFIASWSTRSDDLAQWRAYGGAGIGFELRMSWRLLKTFAYPQDFTLAKCIYEPQEQEQAAREIVEVILREVRKSRRRGENNSAVNSVVPEYLLPLFQFAPLFKHEAFKEEDEWRLVSGPCHAHFTPHFGVREGRSTPVPYIRFNLKDPRTSIRYISEIRVGPCAEPALARQATQAAANAYMPSFHDARTPVSSSRVPYRNW